MAMAAAMAARPPQRPSPASRMPFGHRRRLFALRRTAGRPMAQQEVGRAAGLTHFRRSAGMRRSGIFVGSRKK